MWGSDLHGHVSAGLHRQRLRRKRPGFYIFTAPVLDLAQKGAGDDVLPADREPAHPPGRHDDPQHCAGGRRLRAATEERQHLGCSSGENAAWARVRARLAGNRGRVS